MITTEDVRRASRTGETLRAGGVELTLDYLVRLPASDWDDWIELRAFAARREAKRMRVAARFAPSGPLPVAAVPAYIDGEVVEPAPELPAVRRKQAAV
jgi:hypothetical protein